MDNTYIAGLYGGEPYVSGEQPGPGAVKLNTNENPYPPAPGARRALAEFDGGKLRLYPKQDGGTLRVAIAKEHGVSPENVFVGNGSDEVLALAFRAVFGFGKDRPVLFPDITYSFYPVWCGFFGIPFETVAVGEGFLPNAADYCRANGGIVICEPNAPTSVAAGEAFVKEIVHNNGDSSTVIVDEAYADFSDFSAVSMAAGAPNLLAVRSFSKGRSLAGLRIGYAIGSPRLIRALMAAKDSFNSYPIDKVAEAVGTAALEDGEYYRSVVGRICETRGATAARLRSLGFDVPEPAANFVFAGCGSAARARGLFNFLREGGVYVRYFDKPGMDDRLRVSIGLPEEMGAFFARLEAYLAL